MNYTVFDVETANSQRDSICAIGVIRYENNQVVYEKEILINPETEFNYFNTKIPLGSESLPKGIFYVQGNYINFNKIKIVQIYING